MSNQKNLPINFEPRAKDFGNTVGGGNNKDPKWLLSDESLRRRKEELVAYVEKIKLDWDKTSIEGLPHTLSVTFIDEAQANTHQKKIISMFDVGEGNGQIGFIGEKSIMIEVNSKGNLDEIKENLSNTSSNSHQISAITKICLFEPEIKITDSEKECKLIPLVYNNTILNEKALRIIKTQLSEKNIKNKLVSYSSNIKTFQLYNITKDSLKFIRTLPIRSVEPISKVNIPFPNVDKQLINDDKLLKFNPKGEYPVVGLLDSGVAKNKLTTGWVTRGKGCNYKSSDLDTSHGTYIATLLIYGNTLNKNKDSSIDGCKIVDVPVAPRFRITEDELIKNIEKAVECNPEVRVWNLSVSLSCEISDNEFSTFAIALDTIQKEKNVIICKSAGNDSEFFTKKHAGKISTGAESIRALTVGSINRNTDGYRYTVKNFPAKYSRHGPAPALLVKPDVTHFGGDCFAMKPSPSEAQDFEIVSDTASSDGVRLTHNAGTSFSTPKIAKNVAELDLLTKHKYNLMTLKALEVHSSRYFEMPPLDVQKRLDYMGYGKPTNAGDTIFDPFFASTLILQGKLVKGQRVDIMDFPYPTDLIKNGYYTGRIKITLAYDPILFSNQGIQYCQSNLDIKFGTYDKKIDTTDFLKKFNPIKREGSFNTLLSSKYAKRSINNHTAYANERTLIKYGQKYHPIKKYAFDLSELQKSLNDNILSERHWFLFIEGHYRDYAEKHLKTDELYMPYSLIITIEDPERKANVYNSTISALNNNNFYHSDVSINNHINLSN